MRDWPLLAAAALALSMTRKAPGSGVLCDLVFMPTRLEQQKYSLSVKAIDSE
jgi:hypothetical protein